MSRLGLNVRTLSRAIDVTPARISEILSGRRAITAETALRLGKVFGTSAQFWLYLQADYDLREAERKWSKDLNRKIKCIDMGNIPAATCKPGKDACEERAAAPIDVKLEGNEKVIFDLLGDEPMPFEDLAKKSGLPTGNISAALTMLEIYGFATRRAGDRYVRCSGN